MSDITIPSTAPAPALAAPTAPTAPAPAPEAGVSVDNAAFARLRTQADTHKAEAATEKARADALATKLAEIETASLTEVEKLRKDVADLTPIKGEHEKYASTLQELYDAELAFVPEEKRESVKALSATGDLAARLKSLRAAAALIGTAPAPAGTVTQPGRSGEAAPPETKPDPSKLSWGNAVSMSTNTRR